MSEIDELLDIVDEHNQVITQAARGEAYQTGLLHRGANIFIQNSQGEILIQKRSSKKLKYPGAFDLSASEHVKAGESIVEAAKRGLQEELGIEIPLKIIQPLHRQDITYQTTADNIIDNELVETYLGIYDGQFKIDPVELAEVKFFTIAEINQMLKNPKFQFTSWFVDEWGLCGF